jgi:hypothetical protein
MAGSFVPLAFTRTWYYPIRVARITTAVADRYAAPESEGLEVRVLSSAALPDLSLPPLSP